MRFFFLGGKLGACAAQIGTKPMWLTGRFRGDGQHLRIGYANHPTVVGAQNIDGRFSPAKPNYNFVIEIGIRLKPRPHTVGV